MIARLDYPKRDGARTAQRNLGEVLYRVPTETGPIYSPVY